MFCHLRISNICGNRKAKFIPKKKRIYAKLTIRMSIGILVVRPLNDNDVNIGRKGFDCMRQSHNLAGTTNLCKAVALPINLVSSVPFGYSKNMEEEILLQSSLFHSHTHLLSSDRKFGFWARQRNTAERTYSFHNNMSMHIPFLPQYLYFSLLFFHFVVVVMLIS